MSDANNELEVEQRKKSKQAEKQTNIETRLKGFFTAVFETINPNQKSAPTAERLIRLITIYQWYRQDFFN